MRKVVFIIIAVAVVAVMVFFGWREFRVPTINYVGDRDVLVTSNHLRVHRMYSAEIDHTAYQESLDAIMYLTQEAFTEEELFQAALEAGRPSFFPWFNFVASNAVHENEDEIWVDGYITLGFAEGQTEGRFRMGETSVEAITQGDLTIERFEVFAPPGGGVDPLPKVFTGAQAAVDVTGQSAFRVALTGESGMLTLQLVYSIDVETPLVLTVQEERLMQIHVIISLDDFGALETEFIVEPYSNLEQLLEEQA
jgi:hypothetical protein